MTNVNSSLNVTNTKISKKIIQKIYQSEKKIYSKSFILKWTYNLDTNKSKMLISVPKKHIKKAVDRNYIKRTIKEVYGSGGNNVLLSATQAIYFILIYNKATRVKFNKLKPELLTLFQILIDNINENN